MAFNSSISLEYWASKNSFRSEIPEKGLFFNKEDGREDAFIVQTIEHFKWSKFARPPGSFSFTLVGEFYKNLNETNNVSSVLERPGDFSPTTINKLFSFTKVDDSATLKLLDNPDFELMEKCLCPYGAYWSYTSTSNKLYLKGKNIRKEAKPSLAFLSSRLIPNPDLSMIDIPRLSLLFALYYRKNIDIGNLINININIKRCHREFTVQQWWFPSTITSLIKQAGIVPSIESSVESSEFTSKELWNKCGETEGQRNRKGYEIILQAMEEKIMVGIAEMETKLAAKMMVQFEEIKTKLEELLMVRAGAIKTQGLEKFNEKEHLEFPANLTGDMNTNWGYTNPSMDFLSPTFYNPSASSFSNFLLDDNFMYFSQIVPSCLPTLPSLLADFSDVNNFITILSHNLEPDLKKKGKRPRDGVGGGNE